MRSGSRLSIAGLAVAALSIAGACQTNHDDTADRTPTIASSSTSKPARADSSGGEVEGGWTGEPVAGRWLTDANVLALLGTMNSAQIAAANVELGGWHSDSARAFAASVAREHAEFQHSVDSLSGRLGITPVAPALAQQIAEAMQSPIDSMKAYRGGALDRAFLAQQVQGQTLMADYVGQMSGVAERPELQAFLASASQSIADQASRAGTLQRAFIAADSLAASATADSLAKRSAHRKH